jgi:hypothetical protein
VIIVVSIEIGVVDKVLVADDYRNQTFWYIYTEYDVKFTVITVVIVDEEDWIVEISTGKVSVVMTAIVELIESVVENSVVSSVVTA